MTYPFHLFLRIIACCGIASLFLITVNSHAQGVGINSTGADPHPSSGLDIQFSDRGMLIPRLSTTERDAIPSPAEGLQLFNTTTKCIEIFAYGEWQNVFCAQCVAPSEAGTISGTNTVCAGQNEIVFSVSPIAAANTYNWIYSGTGATISNAGNSVQIDFAPTATSGILTVSGENICGTGDSSPGFSIVVNSIPAPPVANAATGITQTAFTANWGFSAGATTYFIDVATDSDFSNLIHSNLNTGNVNTYNFTSLSCETTYYYRVRAVNACGMSSNSGVISHTLVDCWLCGSPLVDTRDSQSYPTVQIGANCWMAKNLNIGTMITGSGAGALQTNTSVIQKFCYSNTASNCTTYGGLYEWDQAMNYSTTSSATPSGRQGICPTGWHIPSDNEWSLLEHYLETSLEPTGSTPLSDFQTLTMYRGTNSTAGAGHKMKSTSTWNSSGNGSNSSGFNGLGAGMRNGATGSFSNLGTWSYYWSSTQSSSTHGYRRRLDNGDPRAYRTGYDKTYAGSVRCMKD